MEIRELKKQIHETRNETASVKSAYEKQVALLQGKVISLEEENEDLLKSKGKISHHKPAGNSGCFSFLIFVAIFVFIAWFIFSKITGSKNTFDDIRDKIRIEHN